MRQDARKNSKKVVVRYAIIIEETHKKVNPFSEEKGLTGRFGYKLEKETNNKFLSYVRGKKKRKTAAGRKERHNLPFGPEGTEG